MKRRVTVLRGMASAFLALATLAAVAAEPAASDSAAATGTTQGALAVWDFDGTILEGDCSEGLRKGATTVYPGLIADCIRAGFAADYHGDEGVARFWREYEGKIASGRKREAYEDVARIFAGAEVERIEAFARKRFAETMKPHLFAYSLRRFQELESAGVENHVVSASPEFFVQASSETLGVPRSRVHGIRLAVKDGRLVNRIVEPFPYGDGKTEWVRKLEKSSGRKALYGFGNSYGTDGPFLKAIARQNGTALMINGGKDVPGMTELFVCTNLETTCGTVAGFAESREETLKGTVVGDVTVSVPATGGWSAAAAQETRDGVTVVTVRLSAPEAAKPPPFTVSFACSGVGADRVWTPYDDRYMIRPKEWGATPYESQLAFRAPLATAFRDNGENVLSLAASEAFDAVRYGLTVGSSDCRLYGTLSFFASYAAPRKSYETKIRIDRRKVRWSEGVSGAADWVSETAGLEPCPVPEAARDPLYSTWYAFWQDVRADVLEKEAPLAASLGMKTMILDDGWQKVRSHSFYSATGDWMPVPGRFPDMKAHVAKVHAAGLKYMLWFSVPFVGIESKAWSRFRDKFLFDPGTDAGAVGTLDPRFPEVREYLIATYERAVRDWGFDGLKLDFIDCFKINGTDPAERDDWKGRDIRSLPVAVDTLMKDVRRRLTAIRPDILIEFRQQYMGPAIRQYGNMIRATDCPADSDKIRKLVCDLRLTSGKTAVHSDMLVWSPDETPERAARPILNSLFSTIQYSMVLARLPETHREVIRHWLAFTQAHRGTLLGGAFRPEHPEALYPLVSAESADERITGVYTAGTVVPVPVGKTTCVINATDAADLVIDAAEAGTARVFDTLGRPRGTVALKAGLTRVPVPVSGYLEVK